MKKLLSVVLVLALMISLFAACGGDKPSTGTGEPAVGSGEESPAGGETAGTDKPIKVAMLYAGFLGDKSYNDSAHEGAVRAMEQYGVEIKEMESKDPSDWETNFIAMASEDYDLIIGVSSEYGEIMARNCPNFPDKKFALIDSSVEGDNILSFVFAQNEGSFLAGAAAAMFTTHNEIEGVNEENVIGWVGGLEIPVLTDFFIGYEQGAKHIDPNITVLQSFAGSFSDPLKGKELTLAQYSQGADIVMNVASGTGTGVLEAAKESGRFAIGVDLDQDGVYPGSILTSMLKRVDAAIFTAIEAVANDTFEGNQMFYMNIAAGGVGLTEMAVMKEALGDQFPEEILTRIAELEEEIKAGTIVVANNDGFGPGA